MKRDTPLSISLSLSWLVQLTKTKNSNITVFCSFHLNLISILTLVHRVYPTYFLMYFDYLTFDTLYVFKVYLTRDTNNMHAINPYRLPLSGSKKNLSHLKIHINHFTYMNFYSVAFGRVSFISSRYANDLCPLFIRLQ